MRWIRTSQDKKAHAVFKRHDGKALCGVKLSQATSISPPGADDRCGQCDYLWRARGLTQRPAKLAQDLAIYEPRFQFEDS